ncbi:hypothetical protein ILUMI_00157, partial [Ignelater luminosus]
DPSTYGQVWAVQDPPKVFARKGKKQVSAITSDKHCEYVTVVVCVNAIENFVPSALIISRKDHKAKYLDGERPGTLRCAMSPAVWAYKYAATVRNATNGFEKSEMYLFNQHIFPEEFFLHNEVIENDIETIEEKMYIASVPENIAQKVEGPSW